MKENYLRWCRHVLRIPLDAIFRKSEMINVNGTRRDRGKHKETLSILNLIKHMTFYISQ